MGKQVTIKAKYSRVILPDGKAYDGNDVATLSDADFARMSADLLSYVTVGSTVADPVSSLDLSGDTQQDAASIQAYIDAALVALAASYAPLNPDPFEDVSADFGVPAGSLRVCRCGPWVTMHVDVPTPGWSTDGHLAAKYRPAGFETFAVANPSSDTLIDGYMRVYDDGYVGVSEPNGNNTFDNAGASGSGTWLAADSFA